MSLPTSTADHLLFHARLTDAERRAVERGTAKGDFVRVRRGVFVPAAVWNVLSDHERAELRLHALAAVSSRPPVFSHWSAALLLGLPVPFSALGTVHRATAASNAARQPGVVTHLQPVPAFDVVEVRGLLVTSAARTVCDIAASGLFELGVVTADAALRLFRCGTEEGRELLREAWGRAGDRRGTQKVAAVIAFADAVAESAAESRSRVTMHRLGVPVPVLQQRFEDRDGFIGRGDFWFPELHVIGEVDGKVKYFDDAMTKGDPAAVHYTEKIRRERLEATGERVVRWEWRHAVSTALLGPRLASAGVFGRRPMAGHR